MDTKAATMMLAALCAFAGAGLVQAQVAPSTINAPGPAKVVPGVAPAASASSLPPTTTTSPGTPIDRIVAIVNGDLILDSDVDQELRLEALEPYDNPEREGSRDQAVNRLINRALILQQVKLQNDEPIPADEVEKELDGLRKNIPECKRYDCATKAGWDAFLAKQGFTEQSLQGLWAQRMQVLDYIEQRFKMGIRITPQEIQDYYTKTMLPEYAAQHVAAPKLDTLSERIQEVLLSQHVTALLDDWLKSLRAQGSIVVMHPGEVAP
ncbi:hypothetical protein SAMN05421819_1411 [Bryocella elongata]|uniref:SurA N-terminal domain-containing protein n=1 Tax=Bryocella elongata TaxID=863522 RepID=A0A1H5W295_9BACT|nr:peptidylprolyl isomerase [Bryocella elongata]SEF93523.1 hypothetical protein SAMN05421819_1411 [Bryocella elongata]